MRVYNMLSPRTNNPVANQFIIVDNMGAEYFQSYRSIIAKRSEGRVYLDEYYWNYSRTTSKYRTEFLGFNTKETEAKIASGEFILTDLNNQ